MKLCVVSTAPLDDLEAWVRESFRDVKPSPAAPSIDGAWTRSAWAAPFDMKMDT